MEKNEIINKINEAQEQHKKFRVFTLCGEISADYYEFDIYIPDVINFYKNGEFVGAIIINTIIEITV